MDKKKTWTVTRIVKEEYQVNATSREEALSRVGLDGGPHTITVIKETAKISNNA